MGIKKSDCKEALCYKVSLFLQILRRSSVFLCGKVSVELTDEVQTQPIFRLPEKEETDCHTYPLYACDDGLAVDPNSREWS